MILIISRHLEPDLTGESPSIVLTKFTRRHHPHTVNQKWPQGNAQNIQNELSNQDVQKMVRVLENMEPCLTT